MKNIIGLCIIAFCLATSVYAQTPDRECNSETDLWGHTKTVCKDVKPFDLFAPLKAAQAKNRQAAEAAHARANAAAEAAQARAVADAQIRAAKAQTQAAEAQTQAAEAEARAAEARAAAANTAAVPEVKSQQAPVV